MAGEIDQEAAGKKTEGEASALDTIYGESGLEEAPKKPEVDHSKLYVWIADSGNDRIQKFDGNGKFISQFGSSAGTRPPYNPGEFKTPSGVTVDVEGNVWVADTGCHRIQKFDGDGDFIVLWTYDISEPTTEQIASYETAGNTEENNILP